VSDFKDTYRCPDCRRTGAPISDEASADEYRRGWHVTCPECGFSISGHSKAIVMQALAVVQRWKADVDAVMGETTT
jgi:DNA-directed RNA polymerase subunit RPC12/RpoP